MSNVGIFSNAYINFADGVSVYPLTPAYRAALEHGTTHVSISVGNVNRELVFSI